MCVSKYIYGDYNDKFAYELAMRKSVWTLDHFGVLLQWLLVCPCGMPWHRPGASGYQLGQLVSGVFVLWKFKAIYGVPYVEPRPYGPD